MIQKRERIDLYDKFRQGAIPSGADFADLIRSQLNLMDDGIDVSDDINDPICLRSHGDNENYLDLATRSGTKKWRISGRSEDLKQEGLNIKAEDQSKFYIERETGNIGVNTDKPGAMLHIVQTGAINALRIDDEDGDQTPLVINSSGQVGLGTGNPTAHLHLSYAGSGDIIRVDDKDADDTPFIIDEIGNVGIGFDDPQTQLVVKGKVAIGANEDHEDVKLYVDGNIKVTGSVVFSGDKGLQLKAPLTSLTEELIIMDNLKVMGDEHQENSKGNLRVTGHTTLGTYNEIYENQSVVSINGRIRSGGDHDSSIIQYELEINDLLTINRNPEYFLVTVAGNLLVDGNSTLGNNLDDDYIFLNGTIQRKGGLGVTIDDNLTVSQTSSLNNVEVGNNLTVSHTSSLYDVEVGNNLTVSKTSSLYDATIANNLTVMKNTNLSSAVINSLTLQNNVTVNKISTDNSLSGKSDSAIPTEKAVKEYVDNRINAIQIVYA